MNLFHYIPHKNEQKLGLTWCCNTKYIAIVYPNLTLTLTIV